MGELEGTIVGNEVGIATVGVCVGEVVGVPIDGGRVGVDDARVVGTTVSQA